MRLYPTNAYNYSDNLKINNEYVNVLGLKPTKKLPNRNFPAGTSYLYLYQSYFIPPPVNWVNIRSLSF